MTRQRRSHLALIALVPVLAFAAVRCADSSAPLPSARPPAAASRPPLATTIAKLHEKTDWIGEFHNDALRYVFGRISRMPLKSRDKHSVCETARRAYAEFHQARRGKPVPASVDAQLEGYCSVGAAASARAASVGLPPAAPRADVSASAQALMDAIAFAVDAATSYEDLSNQIASIESAAASSLSYEEAEGVFAVGSIALNSATYWANSVTDWVPFTNTADSSVLLATKMIPSSRNVLPAFGSGVGLKGRYNWSDWATQVWNDAKAAARRAAGSDVRAGAKAIIAAGVAELPLVYDIVIATAAAGSIGAVLQL